MVERSVPLTGVDVGARGDPLRAAGELRLPRHRLASGEDQCAGRLAGGLSVAAHVPQRAGGGGVSPVAILPT